MRDCDALRSAGGARGEDHPAVIGRLRFSERGDLVRSAAVPDVDREPVGDHSGALRLGEDGARSLIRIVHVDGDIGAADHEDAEDGRVEVRRPGRDAHAHCVARPHPGICQGECAVPHRLEQLPVPQHRRPVVDGGRVRVRGSGLHDQIDECAGRRRPIAGGELRRVHLRRRLVGDVGHVSVSPALRDGRIDDIRSR